MVQDKVLIERGRGMSVRNRKAKPLTSTNKSHSNPYSHVNTDNSKFKKNVIFDNINQKHDLNMNFSNLSSNGSDVRGNPNNVSFGRTSRMSAHSIRSLGGASNSSSSTESTRLTTPRRSASSPAIPRPLQRERVRSSTESVSSTRLSTRNSMESLTTPRNISSRGTKRKDQLCKSKSSSIDSLNSNDSSNKHYSHTLTPEHLALAEQRKMAWEQFSTHVKMIDDSTELFARTQKKTFGSSGIFQRTMEDLYGSPEYCKGIMKLQSRVGSIAKFATKFITGARKVKALNNRKEEQNENDMYLVYKPSAETIENAQRGWRILRRYVQEMAVEKRMNQSTLSWDMLRHTIKGISNMERARLDLYRRYGLLPIIQSDGSIIQENTMLSERARSALVSKPRQSQTPSTPSTPKRFSSALPRVRTPKSCGIALAHNGVRGNINNLYV